MATEGEISDVLTNLALPKSNATLTLRIIKSFEFRTEKSLVLHGVNLETTTVGQLKDRARQGAYYLANMAALVHVGNVCQSQPSRLRQDGNHIVTQSSVSLPPLAFKFAAEDETPHRHHEAIYKGARCQSKRCCPPWHTITSYRRRSDYEPYHQS